MSKVSRSVYQKKSEQYKSLLSDMKCIVMCNKTLSDEAKQIFTKWRKHFQEEQDFNNLMKEYATEYAKKHPEEFKFLNENTVKLREGCDSSCPDFGYNCNINELFKTCPKKIH
jgi:tRNA A37 methylthiotransferase MiaB